MAEAENPNGEERRSEIRKTTVYRPALLETEEFSGFCLIRNLSPTGMMGKVYYPFKVGTGISIQFDLDVSAAGAVTWCENGMIGIKFSDPIDVTEIL